MDIQLLINIRINREKFVMEDYLGSDDIFALVKSGSFKFESKYGKFTVRENEGALFRRNVLYHREIISPVCMYFFRYRSDSPVFLNDKIVFKDRNRIASTLHLLEQLDSGIFENEFELRSALFSDLIAQYTIENSVRIPGPNADNDPIQYAILQISKNLHKKIILSEISEKTGLSYVQFIRRFRASTGMTPSDYVCKLRLQKAKNMLTDTDLSIREIAYACGFENEYYFSNFFKKRVLMSPSAYRKETMK